CRKIEPESISLFCDGVYTAVGSDLHACALCLSEQTIDDRLRRVSDREHSAVCFRLEPHIALFEPADGVFGLKTIIRSDKFALAARVIVGEFARIEAGVGYVTTTSAGDAHFFEDLSGFFQDDDFGRRILLGASNGGKKSSSTSTNYRNTLTQG